MADLADVCARYRKLYAGVIYDILSRHKLNNQVLSRHIRALRPDFVVAGPAMPFRGNVGPPQKNGDFKIGQLIDAVSEHCILVYAPGQEQESGHLGELTCAASFAHGARGAVVDGGMRDASHLLKRDFPCYARYSSPIEAGSRQQLGDINVPVHMAGSITAMVAVHPGDMIFADVDGVVVIPQDIAEEVLEEAEADKKTEDLARADILNGMSPKEAYEKYKKF